MRVMRLKLPNPPTTNRLYRHVAQGAVLSREGRGYRERVGKIVATLPGLDAVGERRLRHRITVHAERQGYDLDSCVTAPQDALAAALGFDDRQIDQLEVVRGVQARPGYLDVEMRKA